MSQINLKSNKIWIRNDFQNKIYLKTKIYSIFIHIFTKNQYIWDL